MINLRKQLELILVILFVIIFLLITITTEAQELPPNIWIQLTQTENGYGFECQNECNAFQQLGTNEELDKHFEQYHCAINWYYALVNRKYGYINLVYLVGPNGDTSNPLCQNFIE